MTKLITPPAVLRDPFVDQPETRESGDSLYHITLEFAAIEDVQPLIKQIEKLMPKSKWSKETLEGTDEDN